MNKGLKKIGLHFYTDRYDASLNGRDIPGSFDMANIFVSESEFDNLRPAIERKIAKMKAQPSTWPHLSQQTITRVSVFRSGYGKIETLTL